MRSFHWSPCFYEEFICFGVGYVVFLCVARKGVRGGLVFLGQVILQHAKSRFFLLVPS